MKLFASLTSPYARKIRILLAEKRLPFELVVDSPWEANTRVPDINPLGKVPALVTDDGEVFFDSPVIAGYLETLDASPAMLPEDRLEAVRVRQTEALADGIIDAAVATVLEGRRPQAQRSESEVARQIDKIERSLAELERRAHNRQWLHGDAIGLGDVAVGVALGYLDLRRPELDWRARNPLLATLAERLCARESFVDTKPPVS
ncbi:MAG: glutathione S-transferase [Aromatoleum sp.]|jgi:glutathione S-transferase|uniref:glutathione S-transferase n=1 Tax=Aromatoleum sp. TaxID=2307007 RepID=UPI0028954681|nr:glutathione S-transferase [Aromatoleum sp.]MDT3670510.1 glutathione S-transferase [Aromatoleum sp.]